MSLLDNPHYKYTKFGVEVQNWNYRPSKGDKFSKEIVLCRNHLKILETRFNILNDRRKVNSLKSRVITLFPEGYCKICGV